MSSTEARVCIAHEALLTHWDRARQWILDSRSDLQLEERLEADAKRWVEAAHSDKLSLLRPSGLPLNEAEGLLFRRSNELTQYVARELFSTASTSIARLRVRVRGGRV